MELTAAERWAATFDRPFSSADAFEILDQAAEEDDHDTVEAISEWLDYN